MSLVWCQLLAGGVDMTFSLTQAGGHQSRNGPASHQEEVCNSVTCLSQGGQRQILLRVKTGLTAHERFISLLAEHSNN